MSEMNISKTNYETQIAINARNKALSQTLSWLESLAFLWLILHFSGAALALLTTDFTDLEASNPLLRLLWYPSYGLIALLALVHFPKFLRMSVLNTLILLCVAMCGVSYLWSVLPDVTFRRTIAIIMTTSFGLLLAARYDWCELIQRLAFAYFILAVGSFIFGLALPEYGRMQMIHEGSWRGMWLEKNSFGQHMVRGLLLMMCAFIMRPDRWMFWVPAAGLCLLLVLLSTSKMALLAALFMIAGFAFVWIMRNFPLLRLPLLFLTALTLIIFTLLMMTIPDEMFGLIGKDASFTGRTDIWDALFRAGKQKLWLGYGYGTFWNDPLGPSYSVRFSLEWGVPTAHNGWMETWLSCGLVAVILFAVTYLLSLVLAVERFARGGDESYWALLSVVLFFVLSLSESTVLQQNSLDWVIYVATAAKLFAFDPAYWRGETQRPYWQKVA